MKTKTILILSIIVLLAEAFSQNPSRAPRMTENDFGVGALYLKMPIDSVKKYLGAPDSVRNSNGEWGDFTAHYYRGVVIWTSNEDSNIWTLDIYNPSLTTPRGLKIGDSVELIDKLYPTRKINISKTQFGRVGPYDFSFTNYSEYRLYDYVPNETVGWVLILFTNKDILTKMLFYVGIPE